MKITIKGDYNDELNYGEIVLTDNDLDNSNFVELIVGEMPVMVSVTELASAVNAFLEKRFQDNK